MAYKNKEQAQQDRPTYVSDLYEKALANDAIVPISKERIVIGMGEFEELARLSHKTFQRIINCGIIEDATVRLGNKLIFDFPLAMQLIQEYNRRQGTQ